MKKIVYVLSTFLICLLTIVPFTCFAEHSNDEIYDITKDTQNMSYDIWNYINNSIYPKIQSQGSLSQADVNAIKSQMNTVETKVNNINVQKDIENYYNSLPEDDGTAKGHILSFGQSLLDTSEMYWNSVGNAIVKSNSGEYLVPTYATGTTINYFQTKLNPEEYYKNATKNTAYNIFRSLGYSLVLLFFSLSLIENTIKLDAFSLKGGAIMFGRLAVSKIIIDMAGKVCTAILEVCATTCGKMLTASATQLDFSGDITNLFQKSDVKFVGGIIDVFTALGVIIPILVITIPILICSILIIIKLVTRGLELTMLVIVSPTFFACYSSDVTKQYTKTFVVTFLQVALQVVFMMVVFYIGSNWLSATMKASNYTSAINWMLAMFPNLLFIIVITKMMIKPPRALMHLLH